MNQSNDGGSPRAPLDCDGAVAAIRRFVSGDDLRPDRERLRAHVAGCEACRTYYREFIETAARLARTNRPALASSDETEDDDEGESVTRRVSMLSPVQRRKPSRWVMGLLVALGLIACFALVRPDRASTRVRLEALGGDVRVGLEQIASDGKRIDLKRGQACSTGADSRARLHSAESTALLEPATAVITEDEAALRLHLLEGRMRVEGSAAIVTPVGVVEIDAACAEVRSAGGRLSVLPVRGNVRFTDADGAHLLAPGAEFALAP